MADKTETVIMSGSGAKLTPEILAELKAKYGIDVRIRSSAAAVGKLISAIDMAASYDRTHPGYDRSYDRDPDVGHSIGAVINPAINPGVTDVIKRGGGG